MKYEVFNCVRMIRDNIPEIPKGSEGTILEVYDDAYMVEFFDENHETIPESLRIPVTDEDLELVSLH